MAKDVEIKIKVVNESGDVVEKAVKSMKELETEAGKLKEALANAPIGSEKFKQLSGALKETDKTIEKTKMSTMGLGEKLSSIGGPMGGVIQGFLGMGKAAMAFAMNPIGAIIAAIGLVFVAVTKAIKNSEAAMDGITKITAIFGGIVRPIFEFIENVAVAAINALAEGLETVAGWFGASGEAAGNYADALDAAQDTEKDLAVTRAQTNKQLAEAKEILSDSNATYEERVAALKKVQAAESAQSAQELANKKELLRLAQEDIQLNGASEEAIQKVRDAKIALANIEQDNAAKQRQFNKQEKALAAEKKSAEDAAAKEAEARAKEAAAKAKERRDAAVAGEKAARDQMRKYDEAYTLSLITNEDERAKLQLQYRQEAENREMAAQIKKVESIKKKSKAEIAELKALNEAKVALDKLHLQEINDLFIKQDEAKYEREKAAKAKLEVLSQENHDAMFDQDIVAIYKARDAKLKAAQDEETEFKKLLDAKLITQEQYNQAISDLDKKQRLIMMQAQDAGELLSMKQSKAKLDLALENEKLSFDEKRALIDENNTHLRSVYADTEGQLTKILEDNAAKRKAIDKAEFDLRVQQVGGILTVATDITNAVQAVQDAQMQRELKGAGDNAAKQEEIKKKYFEKGKKTQIANAIIGTIQGAVQAFTSLSSIPVVGPILGGIAAAAALVAGYANVDKIRSTQYEGGGTPGGAVPEAPAQTKSMFADGGLVRGPGTGVSDSISARLSNGESVINARSTAQFGGLLSLINEAGGGKPFAGGGVAGSGGGMNAPIIKTYVVASDVTSQQEADFRIQQVARL